MNVKISVDPGVSARLQQSTQRQIDYKLGPMGESLRWVNVDLKREPSLEAAADVFVCRMQALALDGEKHEVTTRGFQPQVCIADSASRLSRAVIRKGRHAAPSQVMNSRSGLG